MFSGIVEAQGRALAVRRDQSHSSKTGLIVIDVQKPPEFDDLRTGDSICTNGVCLTVETFDQEKMTFALGAETLAITGWTEAWLRAASFNLERSLRMGDRIHGHMVSGHVDGAGVITRVEDAGGSVFLDVQAPANLLRYAWKKGSWAVNGVSLTINSVEGGVVGHCLIPETLRRTNLGAVKVGDWVNLEVDMMARGLVSFLENENHASRLSGQGV
jgi:riboflavin synthase